MRSEPIAAAVMLLAFASPATAADCRQEIDRVTAELQAQGATETEEVATSVMPGADASVELDSEQEAEGASAQTEASVAGDEDEAVSETAEANSSARLDSDGGTGGTQAGAVGSGESGVTAEADIARAADLRDQAMELSSSGSEEDCMRTIDQAKELLGMTS